MQGGVLPPVRQGPRRDAKIPEPVEFAYRIDPARFGLPGGRCRLSEIKPDGTVPLGTAAGTVERSEKLGPRQLKVIEIVPGS